VARDYPGEIDALGSADDTIRYNALKSVLRLTDRKVAWTYAVWDRLVAGLSDESSYQRSIAAMVLCNLAKSDPERRMRKVLGRLLNLTRDEKFVTARQCTQSIWKIASANPGLEGKVVEHLVELYGDCREGKHYNLIRQDIIQSLANLYHEGGSEELMLRAFELIQEEDDPKYRKKYLSCLDPKPGDTDELT
jgi:hypothetical protein